MGIAWPEVGMLLSIYHHPQADKLADFLRPRRLMIVGVGEGPRDLLVDYEP